MAKLEIKQFGDRKIIEASADKQELKMIVNVLDCCWAILEAITKNGRSRILQRKGIRRGASLRG